MFYFGSRWYDQWTGRFLSADNIDPDRTSVQDLNRYSYSLSNPLKYTDPSGHRPVDDEDAGCAEIKCNFDPQYQDDRRPPGAPNDPPPPGPGLDPLYWPRRALQQAGVDAVGLRLNGSVGYWVGGAGNFDNLYNFNTESHSAHVSVAGQLATVGGGGSVGVLLVWGLPDSQGYNAWSGGLQGEYAQGFAGVTGSVSVGQEYNGHRAVTFFLGYAGGTEVSAGGAAGYTWPAEPVLGFIWNHLVKPIIQ